VSAPRRATPEDVPAIGALVRDAYERYVERLGRPPSPMLDDHAAYVERGEQWVLEDAAGAVVGSIVLVPKDDHLFVDNVAVAPALHGRGLGRVLLEHADAEARRLGLSELRLYTNAKMVENQAIYPKLGYEMTGREQVGVYDRVRYRKAL
jgi:N-acetylglutamate synthase-like GNAT family acetyltransferase